MHGILATKWFYKIKFVVVVVVVSDGQLIARLIESLWRKRPQNVRLALAFAWSNSSCPFAKGIIIISLILIDFIDYIEPIFN